MVVSNFSHFTKVTAFPCETPKVCFVSRSEETETTLEVDLARAMNMLLMVFLWLNICIFILIDRSMLFLCCIMFSQFNRVYSSLS